MNAIVERFGDKDALVTAAGDRLVDAITAAIAATRIRPRWAGLVGL